MTNSSEHRLSPAVVIFLFVCFMVVLACFWIRFFSFITLKLSGWKKLVKKFLTDEKPGQTTAFKRCRGTVGISQCRQMFHVEIFPQGLFIAPSFARHLPILIPWTQIRDVTVATGRFGSISLGVVFSNPTRFDLPLNALESIRGKIAAEKFRDAIPYFEFVAQTLKGRSKN